MKTILIKSMYELEQGEKYECNYGNPHGIFVFDKLLNNGDHPYGKGIVGLFTSETYKSLTCIFMLDDIIGKVVEDKDSEDSDAEFDPEQLFVDKICEKISEKVTEERNRCIQAVMDEEEFDGEMPESMWFALCHSDKISATEICRVIVRATKRGILNRINGKN